MKKQYNFYSDAGHGWLAVKRAELVRLGIIGKISSFSYQRGKTVYLEEDCDASLFYGAKKKANEPFEVKEKHQDRSPIRSYDCFSVLLLPSAKLFT